MAGTARHKPCKVSFGDQVMRVFSDQVMRAQPNYVQELLNFSDQVMHARRQFAQFGILPGQNQPHHQLVRVILPVSKPTTQTTPTTCRLSVPPPSRRTGPLNGLVFGDLASSPPLVLVEKAASSSGRTLKRHQLEPPPASPPRHLKSLRQA